MWCESASHESSAMLSSSSSPSSPLYGVPHLPTIINQSAITHRSSAIHHSSAVSPYEPPPICHSGTTPPWITQAREQRVPHRQ